MIRHPGRTAPRRALPGTAGRARTITWPTVLAFGSLAVPFGIVLVRFLTTSTARVTLPDDLALIDLHTRLALGWHQQLGPFDRFGWNHPGPALYYLLTVPYRVLGSGVRAEFVGATLINALAAVGCVAVVRRRGTPVQALWAALCVGLLSVQLSYTGPGSVTYSESALGALVSPWNPTVVVLPLVLVAVLSAAAMARSPLSLLGALLVGSFVVQTDLSTAPLVAALLVPSLAVVLVAAVRSRRARGRTPAVPVPGTVLPPDELVAAAAAVDGGAVAGGSREPRPGGRAARWWAGAGTALLVAAWVPPVVQQVTNHPGNLTLIVRFFTSGRPGQSLHVALWAVAAVNGILAAGPSGVMNAWLAGTAPHVTAAVLVTVAAVLAGVGAVVGGARRREPFATGLGALALGGLAVSVLAATRVTGPLFGYLVVWAVTVPTLALIGVGMLLRARPAPAHALAVPARLLQVDTGPWWQRTARDAGAVAVRFALPAAVGLVGLVLAFRMVALPPLSAASDPAVGSLLHLVAPSLDRNEDVLVGVTGTGLIRVEEFIGLVNQLDAHGYRPRVNAFWKAHFGPTFLATGAEPVQVTLTPWTPASPGLPGYVGRVTDTAVAITGATARPAAPG